MGHSIGRVREIRIASARALEVYVSCQEFMIPSAGQYLAAHDPGNPHEILCTSLFLSEKAGQGFWAAPLSTCSWQPGTNLDLVGPLGHGFSLSKAVQRLGLVALGETVNRLLPLVSLGVASKCAITLFTDMQLPKLPPAVEVYPLSSITDVLHWADFIVIDLPVGMLADLRGLFKLSYGVGLPCPAQVLLTTPMPCIGKAQCGACAIRGRRGWKLACEDGPVLDLHELEW